MPEQSRTKKFRALGVLLILVAASLVGAYEYQQLYPSPSCSHALGSSKVLRTQLAQPTTFGGVTEFALPSPLRAANGIAVASDGSVWFGEQAVPGVAHFYPGNGTLVEYAWPGSYATPPSTDGFCGNKSDIWGVVLWDGKVWVSDTVGNQLVALDPTTGQFSTVKVPTSGAYPYTLTPGPGNTLWMTELFGSKLAELSANGTLREYPLPGGSNSAPVQVVFANSTTGFYDDVGEAGASNGGIYSFNVDHFSPTLVGGKKLSSPSSLTLQSDAVWVALHGSSSVACYNFTTKAWSYYPTSYVNWPGGAVTTLPYFVQANGSEVWANEHYGNRMALINPTTNSLSEYSESDRPTNGSTIVSALTFALGQGRAWFTEWFGNGLGYADASYDSGFSTTIIGNGTVTIPRGSSATVDLVVHDASHQGALNITFADSEGLISTPKNLTFSAPSATVSPQVGGETTVPVTVSALESLQPGTYTAILTATDGITYESSFLKIVVPA